MVEAEGIAVQDVSAGSTSTYSIAGEYSRVTEIQAGSYVFMEFTYSKLGGLDFDSALTVLATVGARQATLKDYDYSILRYDEEHGIFSIDSSCKLKVGDKAELLCGYTPFAVSYFDAYHVVEGDTVVDIWPIIPS